MKNIFKEEDYQELVKRINALTAETPAQWGKMSVDQMLAHINVPFEYTYHPENFKTANPLMKLMMKLFIKPMVVGEKPYKKNSRTAPEFVMKETKDFDKEKKKLLENLQKTFDLGSDYFEGKENKNFGKLTSQEWSNLHLKHIDHHLQQFGV